MSDIKLHPLGLFVIYQFKLTYLDCIVVWYNYNKCEKEGSDKHLFQTENKQITQFFKQKYFLS